MNIPMVVTDLTATLYIDGEMLSVPRDWKNFDKLAALLSDPDGDEADVRSLLTGFNASQPIVQNDTSKGKVVVTRRSVTYDGQPVHTSLARRMIDIANSGLPIDPWISFMENLYANPSISSRNELYDWLTESDMPITADGCFLAYKRVSSGFRDLHTGTMDNSPGTTVTMPGGRSAVDDDRDRTCSRGLHFCSKGYLPHFGAGGGNTVVLLKINPADVVAIPSDYNNQKGRAWRYEVLQEVDIDPSKINWDDSPVVGTDDVKDDPFAFGPDGKPVSNRITFTVTIDVTTDDDENEYDEYGYDVNGYDANGYDAEGYDVDGYYVDGYDGSGGDANG